MIAEEVQAFSLLEPVNLTATVKGRDADLTTIDPHGGSVVVLNVGVVSGTTPTLDVKLQESDAVVRGLAVVAAGATDNGLKTGATTNVNVGAKFTQSGAASIKNVFLMAKQVGTITAGGTVTLTIQSDSAGSPSGTILGTAITIDPSTISATYGFVKFTLLTPVDLADATVYHICITTSKAADASNYISWRSLVVASGGNLETHNGTSWAAVTTTAALEVYAEQYVFTDISGATFAQVTVGTKLKRLGVNTFAQKSIIRPVCTVGGSSPNFQVSMEMLVRAFNQPVAAQA